jgi:hypothetical protein
MRSGSSNLTQLEITLGYDMRDSEETQQSIESFLEQHVGMEHLELNVGFHRLIRKESLYPHANSLETLIVSTERNSQASYYSSADLHDNLNLCKKLEVLAVNTPPIHLGSLMDLGLDFRLGRQRFATAHAATEFEGMLVGAAPKVV